MSRCTTRLSFPVIFLLWSCSFSVVVVLGAMSPEEEHRLVMKADASVIDEKLKEMPYGVLMAPAPLEEHDLPIPTMDPPLPENPKGASSVKITTAAGLGPLNNNKAALSERIRNAMKTMKERMRTLQSSRPRLPKKPIEPPKAPKFPRPSSLVTSNPSDLEVAMKRIEIMASRAGFNMSSIPRRSQLQIVSRLAPKLPAKMNHAVKEELESMSGKLYHYLPEPARDPLIEDDQAFLQHFMDQFDHPHVETDEFYKEVNSHGQQHHSPQKLNSFDFSQVSLTDDPAHEPISISESMTSSISSSAAGAASPAYLESAAPDIHLMPPKFDAGEGEPSALHTYSVSSDDEGVPKPSALVSQYPTHHVEESDPLVTLSSEISNAKSFSAYNATITSRDRLQKSFKVGSVKTYGGGTTSTSAPTEESPFDFDDLLGPTVSVPPKPIRVSVISKDSILVNDSSKEAPGGGGVRTIKYVHVEPLKGQEAVELLTGFDKYLPAESVSKEVRINPKEISVHIDKSAYVPKSQSHHLSLDTYEIPEITTPSTTTTTTEVPTTTTTTEDPYPLTDEEIAATVAELKKYEAEMAGIRQSENSLEVEYPYRLLTPHPLEYPDHPDHPQPSSLEEDSDLVTHLDELLAEIQGGSGKTQESSKSQSQQQQQLPQMQATVLPTLASSHPHLMGPGHRRPHPLLKHRPPLGRPGLGRPLMMGSRLRPLIRHPPAGFPRPAPGNGGSPPRINEVTVSQLPHKFNKECDYFSDELCLLVQDYPIEAITEAMEQNPQVSNALLSKEALHNQKSTSYIDGVHDLGSLENEAAELGSKHPDFAGEGGFLCPSKVAYGRIKKAKSSTSGEWKFIVNYGDKTQTLRLEKCLQPGDACSYIMPHFRTACTQVHNYHRLLAWDPEKGLHTDVFKVPTCCTCHVLGYYVPGTKKSLPQTPAMPPMRRRDHLGMGPARFMGPPRGVRRMIPHLGLHGRKHGLHPMMQLLQNPQSSPIVSPLNVQPPIQIASNSNNPQSSANTTSSQNSEDEVLRSLLLQYATLREKITKLKDSKSTSTATSSSSSAVAAVKRSSKLYSHWPKDIIKALRKRKRQSTISSKNNKMKKPSPEMLKKLKNLLTNSTKLENNPKLKQKIHSYLLKLKKSSSSSKSGKNLSGKGQGGRRGSRNMKMKLSVDKKSSSKQNKSSKPGLSKADAKKRLLFLLSAAKKKLQEEKKVKAQRSMSTSTFSSPSQNRLRSSSSRNNRMLSIPPPLPPARSKVNFESHPIWNYFHKLQNAVAASTSHAHPPLSGARRLRRLF